MKKPKGVELEEDDDDLDEMTDMDGADAPAEPPVSPKKFQFFSLSLSGFLVFLVAFFLGCEETTDLENRLFYFRLRGVRGGDGRSTSEERE